MVKNDKGKESEMHIFIDTVIEILLPIFTFYTSKILLLERVEGRLL